MKPGLGFGGPCFPRDNRLFQYVAQSVGAEDALSRATDKINENVNQRLLETVLSFSRNGGAVGVLGLAYKPFTAVVDCSPGMWLCERLAEAQREVFAHDFLAGPNAAFHNEHVRVCPDPMEIVANGCEVFVITCPWPGYKELFESNRDHLDKKLAIIVDPWRLLALLTPQLKNLRYMTDLGSTPTTISPELAAHV